MAYLWLFSWGHTRSQIQFNYFSSTAGVSLLGGSKSVRARSLGKIVTKNDKKAKVLNAFPSLVFSSKTSFLKKKLSELEDRNRENFPRENGQQPDTPLRHNCIGLDGIHQRVLRELEEVLTEPTSIITHGPGSLERFQLTRTWQKGHPSTGRAGKRVWRTTDLSA